jgi:hypothetical protein
MAGEVLEAARCVFGELSEIAAEKSDERENGRRCQYTGNRKRRNDAPLLRD